MTVWLDFRHQYIGLREKLTEVNLTDEERHEAGLLLACILSELQHPAFDEVRDALYGTAHRPS